MLIAPLACALLISACSSVPTVPPDELQKRSLYEQRVADLSPLDQWTLRARLAMDNGDDGGSGVLNWTRDRVYQRMDFHGALGRGAWQLEAQGDAVRLTQADGSERRANSISALVREQLGHEVPVEALGWWVRGLAAPGDSDRLVLSDEGAPQVLEQQGWNIEFERYRDYDGRLLPQRITARQDEWTVKLAVRDWNWAASPPSQ